MARSAWIFLLVAACARGGSGNGDDQPQKDAPTTQQHDASPPVDAPHGVDASVMVDANMPIDAASSLFCTANAMCTIAGECCITLGGPNGVCGPGTVILGQCVPQ